jgi:catechol 2,3-dioxygenase-like lactoylglutathione lyase family enzyme
MVKTHGLTHLSLVVADPERSARFYEQVFGAEVYFRDGTSVQVRGPGPWVVMAFERGEPDRVGARGGLDHFGFRLVDAADVDAAVAEVEAAGGKLRRRGELAPGFPFAYVEDPDGYEIEIWFE